MAAGSGMTDSNYYGRLAGDFSLPHERHTSNWGSVRTPHLGHQNAV
ncbi:hypothetical protein [Cellulomonas xiejunii]|nr:hypothetical protein [Cellulomonas xiejunii]MCC2314161.1 hypothetical protein [Cellulomonas xiejunii]